ncbi:protein kinase domain containing protein [Stylonychia lemnae]|uniref:non-specific serine/threonine protein kinase n=1 Tax=Stylonychia lemnae TaxID=5949 RepID=A0A078A4J0_STYLE|nr:protein kinase domain containing protein [Stylonychia lemnae]|eukprot:CDW75679.1 protein kinase domain containing protein [Stylonychia lemnae]
MKISNIQFIENQSIDQNLASEETKMTDEQQSSLQEQMVDIATNFSHQNSTQEEAIEQQEEENHQPSLQNSSINGQFSIVRRLGPGTDLHKQVYRVLSIRDSKEYVVKVYMQDEQGQYYLEVANNNLIDRNTTRQVLMLQSVALNEVEAPLLLEGVSYSHYSYFVMPYYRNGTLLDLIMNYNKKERTMPTELKNYLWLQCLLCVYDLLGRSGLSHLDLKPDNFIIDDDYRLRLIDFGHSTLFNQPTNAETGTPNFMAPEIYFRNQRRYIPEKADIFNLGVILHIIQFQKVPFGRALPNDQLYVYVGRNDFNGFFLAHNAVGYPLEGLKLIWQCLQVQAARRPTIHDLLVHPLARQTNPNFTHELMKQILLL